MCALRVSLRRRRWVRRRRAVRTAGLCKVPYRMHACVCAFVRLSSQREGVGRPLCSLACVQGLHPLAWHCSS